MKVFTIYTLCMNRCIEMPQNAIHKIAIEKIINVKRLDPLILKNFNNLHGENWVNILPTSNYTYFILYLDQPYSYSARDHLFYLSTSFADLTNGCFVIMFHYGDI